METSLPDADAIAQASNLALYDLDGKEVKFGDLFKEQKTIVIFIRHFFCGSCKAFVSQLASVRRESLEEAGVNLLIIGCGDYQPIKNYSESTGFRGPSIFADPSRKLFHHFELIENLERTPAGQPKKTYLEGQSFLGNALSSIWKGPMKNPQHIGKQGNISQLGGDFIFGPGDVCSFASRMKHTEDHVEVADLMRCAGVVYP